jgi:hypothetical protein
MLKGKHDVALFTCRVTNRDDLGEVMRCDVGVTPSGEVRIYMCGRHDKHVSLRTAYITKEDVLHKVEKFLLREGIIDSYTTDPVLHLCCLGSDKEIHSLVMMPSDDSYFTFVTLADDDSWYCYENNSLLEIA